MRFGDDLLTVDDDCTDGYLVFRSGLFRLGDRLFHEVFVVHGYSMLSKSVGESASNRFSTVSISVSLQNLALFAILYFSKKRFKVLISASFKAMLIRWFLTNFFRSGTLFVTLLFLRFTFAILRKVSLFR